MQNFVTVLDVQDLDTVVRIVSGTLYSRALFGPRERLALHAYNGRDLVGHVLNVCRLK